MRESLRIFLFFVVTIVVLAVTSDGFAQSLGQNPISGLRDRILDPVVESDVVTLVGNTHPLARAENDRGAIDPETRLERLVLLLQPDATQQQELDALVAAQQKLDSGIYHQWLTPAEYGSRFGASAADVARVTAWLTSHGFTVEPVPAGERLMLFSGTAGQVTETFHVQMHRYEVGGRSHIANSDDPQIPTTLAPVVAGILSLHDFRRVSATRSVRQVARPGSAQPENTQGSAHYLFPADFATIYGLNPLYAAGKNGAGASIAIVGRSNINLSDVSSFRSIAALPANTPAIILDGANPGLVSSDQDEATLDVEWSGGVAPGAAVNFVVAGSTETTDGVDLSAQYIVNNKTASVMSTSFGSCEAEMGSAELTFYNSLWEQAASEGISAFVSSGDSGAAGCDGGSSSEGSVAGVNGLCSSPYSTCVGGTEFNEGSGTYWGASNGAGGGSALSYIREEVWNESARNGGSGLWSSGGGVSEVYTQPSWQRRISGASNNGMRAVPDVALTAAGHDGYLISENGSWYVVSGTSAASPSFAGIMSVVVEKQGGVGQGDANPALYGMLAASENPFHATPSGSNSVPGVNGFSASGAAYNLATGLGSVDANVLVSGWPTSSGGTTQQGFTLKPSVSAETLLPGKSTTFTVTATGTAGFSGAVSLAATAPSGVKVIFTPASVKPGVNATATVMVASGTAARSGSITIRGTSGSITETATVGVTVETAPALSISAAASSMTIAQSKTAALVVTTTTGGVFSGTVSLAVADLPSGVTASWSVASFTSSGAGSTTSTLTLKATTTAALNSYAFTISAAGDGLQAHTSAKVQITPIPAISVTSAAVSMGEGGSAADMVTVSTANTFHTAITFAISGLPTGVTATWSANPVTPSTTVGGATTTLTLKAAKTVAAARGTATITATGGGLSVAKTITVRVQSSSAGGMFPPAGPTKTVQF
jgi:pseudomonalisin